MIQNIRDPVRDTGVGILSDADRWRTFRHTRLLLPPCVGHPWCPVGPVDPWPETWKTWHLAWNLLNSTWRYLIQRRSKWGGMPSIIKPSLITDSFWLNWQTLSMKIRSWRTYGTTKQVFRGQPCAFSTIFASGQHQGSLEGDCSIRSKNNTYCVTIVYHRVI